VSPKTKAQQVKPAQPSTKETKSDDKPIVKKTPPKKDAVSIKTPKKAPVIKEKPKPKKPAPVAKEKHSLKQKTFKSSKVVQNAIAQIEEQVEENTPNPLQESMERLKRQVEKIESARQSPETQPDTRKGTASSTTASVSGEKGKKILDQIKLYQIEIAFRVQRNWAFSEQLVSGKSELTAELAFNVLPNGEIKDIWFDKRSGNAYLDESAYKAIVKSNPVDPHPPGINKSRITVGLRFGPEGLR
jgi:colicin import membrane protein